MPYYSYNKLGFNGNGSAATPTTSNEQLAILALSDKLSYSDLSQTSLIMSSVLDTPNYQQEQSSQSAEQKDPNSKSSILNFRYSQSLLLQKITGVAVGTNHSAFINGNEVKCLFQN